MLALGGGKVSIIFYILIALVVDDFNWAFKVEYVVITAINVLFLCVDISIIKDFLTGKAKLDH
jgi:hypothetical protein